MPDGQPISRRVTISDVAEAAGVTKGTVSRALSGAPGIAEATRLRVRRAAERMGYRPLVQAQSIRTGRAGALGLVIDAAEPDAHAPFLMEFLSGLTRAASAAGLTVSIASARGEAEMRAALATLAEDRKADGFVLPRTGRIDPRADFLDARGIPYVLYGRTAAPGRASYDLAGEVAMRRACLRLAALGHASIGFLGSGETYNFTHLRREGASAGAAEAGVRLCERSGAMSREEAATLAGELMGEGATAIVAATDVLALGAYDAARARGLSVGREVSVIGYDGIMEGRHAVPPLTTFAVDAARAGERVAQLLVRRIAGEPAGALQELETPRLRDGGSVGPPA